MANRINLLKKVSILAGAFFLVLGICTWSFSAVIDAPHNETNSIKCGDCHTYSLWWQYSPTVNSSGTSSAQISDAVCNKCHASPGGSSLNELPHNRESMVGASHDSYLGEWTTTKCLDCHNPHYQEQLTWLTTNSNLSADLFLVTGTISAGSIQVDSATNTTTLSYKNAAAHPGWVDPASWSAKSGPGRGLILVIRDSTEISFEVNGASATTAIIAEAANGAGLITVQGSIPTANAADTDFALIYGQMLKKSITAPNAGAREVKFFDAAITYGDGQVGGSVDPVGTPAQGICQVCHTNTKYYNADGLQPDRTNPGGPRLAATEHYRTSSCTECHPMALGFRSNNVDLVAIAVTPASPSGTAGSPQQFTATGTYADNSTQDLTTSVTWTSSSQAVATINSAGLATAVVAGTTTITAAAGGISGSSALTVVFPAISAGAFTVHIPSTAAPDSGIAVRVFHPATEAIHYPEGAPVVVLANGGHGAPELLPEGVNQGAAAYGYIYVNFLLPGGVSTDGTASGGVYDYRGPSCKRALADVIGYATGRIADTSGQKLKDRLPFAMTSNAGVLGSSNGGNLAITTFADFGGEFPDLAWFLGGESPIGDQTVVIELSATNGMLNPYYIPGTSTVTTCPWPGLDAAIAFDPLASKQLQDPATGTQYSMAGVLFIDGNANGRFDNGEFLFSPIGGPGSMVNGQYLPKGYFSAELAAIIQSQSARLFPSGPPAWLASQTEVAAYWADRDGSLGMAQAHAALPNLLVMDAATLTDHAQIVPDHPHIRSFIQGWLDAGQPFVRLNPDAEYMARVTGQDKANFPDNNANTNAPYPGIDSTLEPETVGGTNISLANTTTAAILELADRARAGNQAANLDAVLANIPPALTAITVTPAGLAVTPGQAVQFTATGTYADSSTQDLTTLATWTSSNQAVATINSAGLVTAIAAGTTTITAASMGISGSTTFTTSTAAAAQPTINITMDLHCDPFSQQLPLENRRTLFRQQLANASWLLDSVDPYGVKVSFLAVGEFYEFCAEASEQAACLPLLARLQTSGGILGTHSHTEYRRGAHDWPLIANGYTNPLATDVRQVWDTNKQLTDEAIHLALGLTAPAAIAAVNTASESHAQLPDPNQLMEEYGYTIREGGADQTMASYFSHVPWHPFRPGQVAITEDLTTPFVTVPQGMVIGQVGEHLGRWQDGTSARKKAEFLQLYANWKERNRTGATPKVWSFGWGVHTQDLNESSASRAAITDLIPWLRDEFVSKADATGKAPARFASYVNVRDEYLAWETEHVGLSSFNYAATSTDYAQYPYLQWANRYLRFARLDSRLATPGADIFLLRAGDYSATTPATYNLALASAVSAPLTVDLSSTFGAGTIKSIKLSDGSTENVSAAAVNLGSEPAVLCSASDCNAILALETPTSSAPQFVDGGGASGINYDATKAAQEPQLTVFADSLYAAWHEANGTANQIRVKRYDGSSWVGVDGGTANGINFDASKAASSAQLTVSGSALYAAWYESNGTVTRIRVKKYDGSSWVWVDGGTANGLNFTPSKNARNPQLTNFGGNLYAIWEEMSPANISQIRVKKYDGSTWVWVDGGLPVGLNHSPTMAATAPQLTEFNGSLYAIWQEKNGAIDQVRVRRYNGTAWDWVDGNTATGINFNPGNNGDRTQLTVFANALYATWREGNAASKYQIRVKKYDGSQWTWADGSGASGINFDPEQDGHESQLTVLGSDMYAIWCEPKASAPTARQVRAKKYDGSAWSWFDGGAATGINYDMARDGNHQQLTAYQGRLYAAWWEATATVAQIRVATFAAVSGP